MVNQDDAEYRKNFHLCIVSFIFYFGITALTVYLVPEYWEDFQYHPSLQLVGIILGSLFVLGFLVTRMIDRPKITRKNAETYLNASITIMVAIFAIIGLIFTILYGSLYSTTSFLPYTVNLTEKNVTIAEINKYTFTLVKEGIVVVLITVYALAAIITSFIYPLTKKLAEFQNEANIILKERLAKGEITIEQFKELKKLVR